MEGRGGAVPLDETVQVDQLPEVRNHEHAAAKPDVHEPLAVAPVPWVARPFEAWVQPYSMYARRQVLRLGFPDPISEYTFQRLVVGSEQLVRHLANLRVLR